ncbi:MAG TPA: aminotransferase class I/II-fold pyridoxal phosphate-dependent enzyme [Propionibacteriaceae bacterium]|nr:aminotransferase class I/II-fold pyridoxal phosphate-dependent enzyme [Propionibacteriaceae bacterium]
MNDRIDYDLLDAASLRRAGSLKWTQFPDAIGAWVAEMDFGTAPAVTEALHGAVDAALFGYLPARVSDAMSEACAGWYREVAGWQISAEQIHPIADVLKGLEIALEHYSRPEAPLIVPTPAYMPFLTVPPALGRRVIEVPVVVSDTGYALDLDGLDAAYRAGGHLLVLCNPFNPLGKVFSAEELLAVSEVVSRHQGRVFSDEIHAPLVYPDHCHVPYASLTEETAGHTVTATSASKAWNLPGLKCAQLVISNQADAAVWEDIWFLASHGTSTLGAVANTAAYTGGREWLAGVLDYLDGSRRRLADLVAEHLPGVSYRMPEGTYIAWLDCRSLDLDQAPADFFREHAGVALTDGAMCGTAGRGSVRMVFGTPRPVLEKAVVALGRAVRDRRR